MAWMNKLYETYVQCSEKFVEGGDALLPVSHTTQQIQIEIVLDEKGHFRRAAIVPSQNAQTIIPCTEKSAGRAGSKPLPHPLCDKLQYVAGDFVRFGGEVTSGYAHDPYEPHRLYLELLSDWVLFDSHPKTSAILSFVENGALISELVKQGILPEGDQTEGKSILLKEWKGEKIQRPPIFGVLSNNQKPEDALVRWRVETLDDPVSGCWEDLSLILSWVRYYESRQSKRGLCMVDGLDCPLAEQHPAKLRHGADRAKLISSNDKSGYTYRGRFLDADQAVGVGFDCTQKAHSALRWLIGRQGYRNGDQVVVTWAIAGKPVVDPFADSLSLFMDIEGKDDNSSEEATTAEVGDVGQAFALRLNRAIAGYGSRIDPTDDIVVMGLDSATPGRMAVMFYRELKGSEFLRRIQAWHLQYAWPQNFGKERHFVGVPSPRDIAEAAFGRRLDDKLKKSTVERLLPCIVDGRRIPNDLIISSTRRASNRIGMDHWEWEKCLGIACGMYKGFNMERRYQMVLEKNRITRDYLYGRLLAVADNIEGYALKLAEENRGRDTTAARLMQRFADRPFSTWRNIELALAPYQSRLRSSEKGRGFLYKREQTLDEIMGVFNPGDFAKDTALSGEFLLGYHCQRSAFFERSNNENDGIEKSEQGEKI